MAIVLLVIFILISTLLVLGVMLSGPRYHGPVTDHFDGKRFYTPGGKKAGSFGDVLKWMLNRDQGEWNEEHSQPQGTRPLAFEKEQIRVTFINHSTFLIQVDGVNILTDPIYSMRPSPFSWMGPKRMRQPGVKLEDLPRIHVLLLSHNHYDHLDLATVRTICGGHHQ